MISKGDQLQIDQQNTKLNKCKQKTVYVMNIIFNSYQMRGKSLYLMVIICLVMRLCSTLQISMITADNTTVNMLTNGQYNSQFIYQAAEFNCSINKLYTYSQSQQQYQSNAGYTIQFSNLNQTMNFTLRSLYNNGFGPSLSTSSCQGINGTCNVNVNNNCPSSIGQFNYFTILQLQVDNLAVPFTYYILCNNSFSTNTFQWGLVILMLFCLGLIILTVVYSKAWSMGGAGIKINYWIIIGFWLLVGIGCVLAETTQNVLTPVAEIVILLIGVGGIWVCSNELIFLLKISFLQQGIDVKDIFKIRILDVVSLLIGIGVAVGYEFSSKNWIINDILCVSIIIAAIKIMKYTNLKISLFALVVGLVVQMTIVEYIHFVKQTSYNDLVLNNYNFPFQLQFPTLNPVYKQKCAWLPFTAIINPAIFMSYLRRFDISRNTNIYFLTSITCFVLGSVVWMFISIGSVHSWPFQIVTGPIMMGLVAIFAYKRREIRTLWDGSFYDEDFANRDGLLEIMEIVNQEPSPKQSQGTQPIELIRNSVMRQLRLSKRDDSDMTVLKKISNFSHSIQNHQGQVKSMSSSKG